MSSPQSLIKHLAASIGLRVTRRGLANRFQAIDECLNRMKESGYDPRVVIDGGANVGQFYSLSKRVFSRAHYHLIEPQPACAERLLRLVAKRPAVTEFHKVGITEPGVASLRMTGGGTTGAFAVKDHEPADFEVAATTLDSIFAERIHADDRLLLKLDLESHELKALRGARSLLEVTEVVLVEVAFFDFENWGRPLFTEVLNVMSGAGFELYDFATLAGRPRDQRLRLGDVFFVRRGTLLCADNSWA